MISDLRTYQTYVHPISQEVYNFEVYCTTLENNLWKQPTSKLLLNKNAYLNPLKNELILVRTILPAPLEFVLKRLHCIISIFFTTLFFHFYFVLVMNQKLCEK